jgi:hypothetical protein
MINPLLAAAAFNFIKYASIEYDYFHRPSKTLAIRLRQQRTKFPGLPIWRQTNSLFWQSLNVSNDVDK